MLKKRLTGTIELILAPLIWGAGFIVTRSLNGSAPCELTLTLRYAIAAPVLLLFMNRHFRHLDWKTLAGGCLLGILLCSAQYFQTKSLYIPKATAGQVAFITGLYVIEVPLLGLLFLRTKLNPLQAVGAFLAVPGIFLLNNIERFHFHNYFILALIGSLLFAVHIIATEKLSAHCDVIQITVIQFASAAVFAFLLQLCRSVSFRDFRISTGSILAILYLGLFSTMLGFLLQLLGQQAVSASAAAILLSTETFFGMLFSVLLDGERITASKGVGCSLILISILLVECSESVKSSGQH